MAEATLAWRAGEGLLGQGRAREAEAVYRKLLARIEAGAAFDAGYQRCVVLGSLGRSLRAQGRAGDAKAVYRGELAALAGLAQTDDVRRQTGLAHTDLADALADQGRYAEARAEYEKTLDIMTELGDDRSVAVVQGQLGTLALMQRDLAEARRRHEQARKTFHALGEEQHEAIAWHQLGRVAQEAREWDEAERCYRESLAIKERIGDKAGAAQTCNQLAIVAKNSGRPAQAERWHRKTLEYADLLPDQGAGVYNNLAGLLLAAYTGPDGAARPDLAAAEAYARRALAIDEAINDPSTEIWKDYNILAQIAERRGDAAAARGWRRREQETFAAFPGALTYIQRFQPLIASAAAAAAGDSGSRAQVLDSLPQWKAQGGEWAQLALAFELILAGERDGDQLTEDLPYASALIVRKVLEALAGGGAGAGGQGRGGERERGSGGAGERGSGGAGEQGVSLQEVLGWVVAGCRGDAAAGQRAWAFATQVMQDRRQPAAVQALGVGFQRLLAGERDRDAVLRGLPAEAAEALDAVLAQL